MHAAVLADQPLEVALLVLPFREAHQRPHIGAQVHRVLVGALEIADVLAQVVPFHAGGLASLAADAARHIDELSHLLFKIAGRRRRQGGCRASNVVLRLEIRHGMLPSVPIPKFA